MSNICPNIWQCLKACPNFVSNDEAIASRRFWLSHTVVICAEVVDTVLMCCFKGDNSTLLNRLAVARFCIFKDLSFTKLQCFPERDKLSLSGTESVQAFRPTFSHLFKNARTEALRGCRCFFKKGRRPAKGF